MPIKMPEYPVEKVLDVRELHVTRKLIQYSVKWKDYKDIEWVNVLNMIPGCAKLVRKFHEDNPNRNIPALTQKLLDLHKDMETAGRVDHVDIKFNREIWLEWRKSA